MNVIAHTFSIVGRCPRSGALGVAVSSAVPAVGAMCPYVRAGVGAVSTQSWVNPYLAMSILDALANGEAADAALAAAMAADTGREQRQLGVIDASGKGAAWTGAECTSWCGQRIVPDAAIQGNMLAGEDVLAAMQDTFLAGEALDLDERLMLALEAGQAAGGDKRGSQSAVLKVFEDEDYALLDLRVDEHAAPVGELRRVLGIARAQLLPFVRGMPGKAGPRDLPQDVKAMLLKSPPDRPGGGGSAPQQRPQATRRSA
jgi:uncharacterized Ntn-hydrolase superfamily protein